MKKQRPLFFTFVVNPKKLKNNSFSCFHFYVYNCRLIGLISTPPPSIHTLSYSLCVVWLQKWAFSPFHPVTRLWMATLLFHFPLLPPFTCVIPYDSLFHKMREASLAAIKFQPIFSEQFSVITFHLLSLQNTKEYCCWKLKSWFFSQWPIVLNFNKKCCHALIWNKLFPMNLFHHYSTI